jgi:hypothetical protein
MKRALTTAATLATLLSGCFEEPTPEERGHTKALSLVTSEGYLEVIYGNPVEIHTLNHERTLAICYQQLDTKLIDSIYVQRIAEPPTVVRRISPDTLEQQLYWDTSPKCLAARERLVNAVGVTERWIEPLSTAVVDSTQTPKDTTPAQAYNKLSREAPKDTTPDSAQ